MNRYSVILLLLFLITTVRTVGQTTNFYSENVKQAERYYQNKEYLKAAEFYSSAFASNKDLGRINHRYDAARCWAMAGERDSAFHNLERIARSGYYTKYYTITHDYDLNSLHGDKRWEKLLQVIKSYKEKTEPNLNEPLAAQLDTIADDDQNYREQIQEIEKKDGVQSKELKLQWQTIVQKDSVNVKKVKAILDKYGWLGKDVVGDKGNEALFLVIQHSDQTTQEKYLPMLRQAVKDGRAKASSLALMEDRVALKQGHKQIYGSQIIRNDKTGKYYVRPLEDPENVDKRRAGVQLPPLSEYVKQWGIKWSTEQYQKDLIEQNQ